MKYFEIRKDKLLKNEAVLILSTNIYDKILAGTENFEQLYAYVIWYTGLFSVKKD